MDNQFARRERTLYVSTFDRDVTDDQLYSLFSKVGPIEKLIFRTNPDGTPQHALVVFRWVDSLLEAMDRLQGTEVNGRPICIRPLRESTHHGALAPFPAPGSSSSTSLEMASSSRKKKEQQRATTVTSSEGLLSPRSDDHSADDHNNSNGEGAATIGRKTRRATWNAEGLEAAYENLAINEQRGSGGSGGDRAAASRSCTSHSSATSSSCAAAESHSSLSPRKSCWRPSRGPIPAPLMTSYENAQGEEEYGRFARESRANLAHHSAGLAPPPPPSAPPSLFSQIFSPPSSDGYESPFSPYVSMYGGGGSISRSTTPRPLLPPGLYKPAGGGSCSRRSYGSTYLPTPPTGVFSPTTAPEEVVWRGTQAPPPTPLMDTPGTAPADDSSGQSWFHYGQYSVPQAYRGSSGGGGSTMEQQQLAAAAAGIATAGVAPPDSPPIGQCTRFFDFSDPSAPPPPHLFFPPPPSPLLFPAAPASARPYASRADEGRVAAPASAAPHYHQPFAWPEFRPFTGGF